jgi:hypothetical protein
MEARAQVRNQDASHRPEQHRSSRRQPPPPLRKIVTEERIRSEMMDSLEQAIRQSESRRRAAIPIDENPFLASPSIFDPSPPWEPSSASAIAIAAAIPTDALPTLKTPRFDPNENRPTVPAPERETLAAPTPQGQQKKTTTGVAAIAVAKKQATRKPTNRRSALTLFVFACAIIFAMCLVVDRSARHTVFTFAKITAHQITTAALR